MMLTPKELQITQAEYDGLIHLKEAFKREKIAMIPSHDLSPIPSERSHAAGAIEAALGFDMGFGAALVDKPEVYHCGCAACIGGHLSLAMQGADITGQYFSGKALSIANEYVLDCDEHPSLGNLFYPHVITPTDWKKITPSMAAQAIENLLITGDAGWEEVAESNGLRLSDDDQF